MYGKYISEIQRKNWKVSYVSYSSDVVCEVSLISRLRDRCDYKFHSMTLIIEGGPYIQ